MSVSSIGSLGFYLSAEIPFDLASVGRTYYLYHAGYWYTAPSYWGPWLTMPQRRFPTAPRRYRYELIRDLRDLEYRKPMHESEPYPGHWHHLGEKAKRHRRAEREERRWAFNSLRSSQ
jgi:hypothetical protein